MSNWLTKAFNEGSIRNGTTSTGRPAFLRSVVHVQNKNYF
jgi:hypothetical protein